MAFCTRCGSSNDHDARYCNHCGHELESSALTRTTAEKKNSGRWIWLLMMVFLALAAGGTAWHLENVDFRLTGDAEVKKDSKESPDRVDSSPVKVLEKLPDAREIQKTASKTVDDVFGSDQDVNPMGAGPVPLRKGLSDVEPASSYDYTSQDCNTLFTDVGQQVAYSIQNELTEAAGMTAEEENRLGKQLSRQVEKEYRGNLDTDSAWLSYIRSVGDSLASGVERKGIDYHFHLIRSDKENAFAIPGGGVYVFTGLLKKIKNEAQLAAVLAHEIKHVDLRHCTAVYTVIGNLPDVMHDPALIIARIAKHPYNARAEADADRKGLDLIYGFGYSPYQIVDYWETKPGLGNPSTGSASQKKPFGKILDTVVKEVGNVLSTHPENGKRVCLLKNHIIKLQEEYPMDRVYVGKWNYDNKVTMFKTKM